MNLAETINNYTANEELRAVLIEYFSTIGTDNINHSLKMLNKLKRNENEKVEIVKQSINKGWKAFYRVANLIIG